jgi:hypothetical protein
MQEKQDGTFSLIPCWTGGVPRQMNEVNRLGGVVESLKLNKVFL